MKVHRLFDIKSNTDPAGLILKTTVKVHWLSTLRRILTRLHFVFCRLQRPNSRGSSALWCYRAMECRHTGSKRWAQLAAAAGCPTTPKMPLASSQPGATLWWHNAGCWTMDVPKRHQHYPDEVQHISKRLKLLLARAAYCLVDRSCLCRRRHFSLTPGLILRT